MQAAFFLAADPRALDPVALHAFAERSAIDEGPICYIGAAHDDDRGWAKRTCAKLEQVFGRPSIAPRLSDPSLDLSRARADLRASAILFLDGGDTVGLCDHVRARGLGADFAELARRRTLIAGISAGACAVAPFTIGYDDEDRAQIAPCLELGIGVPLDVHSEGDDWSEMRALLELVRDRPHLPQEGIVIPSRTALLVDRDGVSSSFGVARCERRKLDALGRWVTTVVAAVSR